jgi:hypothetical protein
MAICLPENLFEQDYELAEALREQSVSLAVRPAAPNEADREEMVLKKLGPRGWGRLHHFRYFYGSGWGEGAGKPLSPRALEGFYRFVEHARFPTGVTPSLFFTDAGHLELCWEGPDEAAIQVEFTPEGAQFYQEATGREGSFSYSELSDLLREVSVS